MRSCVDCVGFMCTGHHADTKQKAGECSIRARGVWEDEAISCPMFTPKHAKEEPSVTSTLVERDPTGRQAGEAGAKLDDGKNRLGLVMFGFARALQEVGKVGTYGAKKYSDNGWMDVPDGERRYTDAMCRHLLKEATGEKNDPDSGLLHAAQVSWNALARLELMMRKLEQTKAK